MTMCSAADTALESSNNSSASTNSNNSEKMKTPDTTRNPNRRSNKPIMEKRRRARINNCLNELKGILLEAMRKDPARHSKLEKADILELTVSHLKGLHSRNQNSDGSQYRAGFTECAAEVGRFLSSTSVDGIDHQTSSRLLSHLAECINNPSFSIPAPGNASIINTITSPSNNAGTINNQNQPQQQQHHLLVQQQTHHHHSQLNINSHHHSLNNNNNNNNNLSSHHSHHNHQHVTAIDPHGNATTTINVPPNTPIISLVPSRLSSGEIAFVVPGFSSATAAHHNHHHNASGGSTPSPTIPLSAMQSLHCNPMLSPDVPLELTVPSSSSSGCSLSPNYPVGHGSHYYHHHQHNGIRSFSPSLHHSQPLALVTPKKEEGESCWRPWG